MQSLKFPSGKPVKAPGSRDYLSFSAVSLFASCPLRYFFRYVAGLPEEVVSATLVLGSAFHAGLELHFLELLAGNKAPGIDVLLGAFWETWARNSDNLTIQFGRGDNISSVGNLAERMFLAFQASDLAQPKGRIIAVEEEIRGELIPGLPDLLARVDLLVDTGDGLLLTDFKTARSSWSEEHAAESAGQLLLYHELVKDWGTKPVRLAFAVVSKTKIPQVVLHPVLADSQQIDRTKRLVERVWRAIENGHFYPNPSPINCSTCPYRRPCREWTG